MWKGFNVTSITEIQMKRKAKRASEQKSKQKEKGMSDYDTPIHILDDEILLNKYNNEILLRNFRRSEFLLYATVYNLNRFLFSRNLGQK